MKTLLLDPSSRDLVIDVNGNIAVADDPYSQAQDAASAIRLFQGELWYNTVKGVPYWQSILGKLPPGSLVKTKLVNAARTVPGVVAAVVFLVRRPGRLLGGQVQITDSTGTTLGVNF